MQARRMPAAGASGPVAPVEYGPRRFPGASAGCTPMLVASNITIQFGAKPLFENVSVKFGEGNRYGLIGANGSGKTTFMKILAGVLEPTAGNVSLDPGERMAYLRQDQFAFEDVRVLDVVMMGHAEMWACMAERDAIYANLAYGPSNRAHRDLEPASRLFPRHPRRD